LRYNTLMLVVGFLQWWYGPGWRDAGNRLAIKMRETYLNFSIPSLLRTLFAPWRRISTPPGSSLEQRLRAILDNAISRAVGFTVRILAILAASAMLIFFAVFGGAFLLLWPVLPLLGPALIVGGLL
jgi:hypothetical protein